MYLSADVSVREYETWSNNANNISILSDVLSGKTLALFDTKMFAFLIARSFAGRWSN